MGFHAHFGMRDADRRELRVDARRLDVGDVRAGEIAPRLRLEAVRAVDQHGLDRVVPVRPHARAADPDARHPPSGSTAAADTGRRRRRGLRRSRPREQRRRAVDLDDLELEPALRDEAHEDVVVEAAGRAVRARETTTSARGAPRRPGVRRLRAAGAGSRSQPAQQRQRARRACRPRAHRRQSTEAAWRGGTWRCDRVRRSVVEGASDYSHAPARMSRKAAGARIRRIMPVLHSCNRSTAGRPALHGREPGQVRKEAATAIHCKCRDHGSPPIPAFRPRVNTRGTRRPRRVRRRPNAGRLPGPRLTRTGARRSARVSRRRQSGLTRDNPRMSYQVLARKWRPKTFAELVRAGARRHRARQRAVARAPAPRVPADRHARRRQDDDRAHPRQEPQLPHDGVTATPCGVCAACIDIDAGRFVDLLELDAASNTGIDNMREILDNARYAPTVGPLQGLPDRRSAHAVEGGVQLDAEDARGAARARQVRARDDRPAEDPGHGAVALPAVQPEAADAGADRRAHRAHPDGRGDRARGRRASR